jgi:hypothetical protein
MKFRGPQALGNRRQNTIVCPTRQMRRKILRRYIQNSSNQ